MRWLWLALGLLWAAPAVAVTCENVTWEGLSFSTCTVDPATEDLRLFRTDAAGKVYGSFSAVEQGTGRKLAFAMNAGMFHEDRSPVGLYIEDGVQQMRLITSDGPGNFGLLPNGLLCLNDAGAYVHETLIFETLEASCDYATQSGPMLVIDGELHPRFLPNSTSRYIRNGVGTPLRGDKAVFVISNQPVTFYEFGRFFRDYLGMRNALYFDGKVSRLYAPSLGRNDFGVTLGPIIGVLE